MNILVTGGAGFIGTHLSEMLVEKRHEVTVVDCLDPQVHGPDAQHAKDLPSSVRFIKGDVRDHGIISDLVSKADIVVHLAAVTGIGQSMYDFRRYLDVNVVGTATVLDAILRKSARLKRLVVASSMTVYGEGTYRCLQCGPQFPDLRDEGDIKMGFWEVMCPVCSKDMEPMPTRENRPLHPTSPYALSKRDTEELALQIGRAYDLPVVALRYFNVYGPRQALINPYTGVIAVFAARLLEGKPPIVIEDGAQSRDFIYVKDVARATSIALEAPGVVGRAINIGTGKPTSILQVARILIKALGREEDMKCNPQMIKGSRKGDNRHCFADMALARQALGFEAEYNIERGIHEMIRWLQNAPRTDQFEKALRELSNRNLWVGDKSSMD